jgi:hypothetical protein
MEFGSGYLHLGNAVGREVGLDFFGVRQAVGACIEPRDHDGFMLLRRRWITLGLRSRYENEHCQQTNNHWPSEFRDHRLPSYSQYRMMPLT